jgi:hypothetical protein
MTYYMWLGRDAEFFHLFDKWMDGGTQYGHAVCLARMEMGQEARNNRDLRIKQEFARRQA